jgi:glycerophosphoryl diester phosphodiesterase
VAHGAFNARIQVDLEAMTKSLWLLAILMSVFAVTVQAGEEASVEPLTRAHAHNDYEHQRPLLDALDHGFCSVEADIWLRDGKLLVGHDESSLRPERTLDALYLAPLRKRIAKNEGRVYPKGQRFWLLVDIKTDAKSTYLALHAELEKYADLISTVRDGRLKQQALMVVASGYRARELMAEQPVRYAGFDGRLEDLDSMEPAEFMPMISDRWDKHFSWRGEGSMPTAEREKLQRIVKQAHARGRIVRLWATPELPTVWKELQAAEVDLINTDRLAELRDFLTPHAE